MESAASPKAVLGSAAVPAGPGAPRRLRVLLADDERTITVTLGDAIREAGHEVVLARDGEEAVLALDEGGFDVVVSDMRMPGLDGMAVLRRAKALDPDTEVILMTGSGTEAVATEAIAAGALCYVRKPFYNEKVLEILARVREAG